MKRLVRDGVLIGATAAAVWFVRGDAQQPERVVILCNQGIVQNAQMDDRPFGTDLRWSKDTGGGSSFFDCTITPYLAEDVGP